MQRMLILLVFVYSGCASAQVKTKIFVDLAATESHTFNDSLELVRHLKMLQIKWIDEGYYFSGIDSTSWATDTTIVFLHKGERLNQQIGGKKRNGIVTRLTKYLEGYSNNGYPFASIGLDSLAIKNQTLVGSIAINAGPKIDYDSAYFFNQIKTNTNYIYRLLGIVPGEKFSEKEYRLITKKVNRSSFLSLDKPTDLAFKDNKAKVFLDLKEESANSFQGVVGIQQVPFGKTSIVGNINLDIKNLFRSGKELFFSWERFSEESQQLDVFYKHPFFLDSKISPIFRFGILKQDTSFITRETNLGLEAYISSQKAIAVTYERAVGSILTSDIESISGSGFADFTRALYQLQFTEGNRSLFRTLNKSISWSASLSAGRKEVERNLSLPAQFYDTIETNTNFYRLEGSMIYQLLLFKRQSFYHSIQTGTLLNDVLLKNELYRVGGLTSLRGFNEKSIFAESYMLSRMEFRSFFEKESYAYVFYDQLIATLNDKYKAPFGIGMGFALASSVGQFSFALAVGNSNSQPVSFSAIKVHFGYISRF